MSDANTAAQGQDMGYVGNVTGATHYDHSKGLNHMESAATPYDGGRDEAVTPTERAPEVAAVVGQDAGADSHGGLEAPLARSAAGVSNERVAEATWELWTRVPHMRFGQLVMNLSRPDDGMFADSGFADAWEWSNADWLRKIEKAMRTWAKVPS